MAPQHVFVYGTLLPGADSWPVLRAHVEGEGEPDWVAGVLYDTGLGYPAASFPVGAGTRVIGRTFPLVCDRIEVALAELDEFEDVASGLYRRERVTTGAGVEAWVYVAGDGFDLEEIATGDWLNQA